MIIMGIDPGGTTGIVVLDTDNLEIIASHEFDQDTTVHYLYSVLVEKWTEYAIDEVGIERYTIAGRTLARSRQTAALELIGVTRAFCLISKTPMHLQTPADAKNVWSDERMKEVPIAVPGRHAKDAARHALLLAQRRGTMNRRPEGRTT